MNVDKVIIGPLLTEKGSVLTESLNKYLFKVEKYKLDKFELLTTNAIIAANNRTRPLAASNLKNHLKGLEI